MDNIDSTLKEAQKAIQEANDLSVLEKIRVHYLGKKSQLIDLSKSLAELSDSERRHLGKSINEAKGQIQQWIHEKKALLEQARLQEQLSTQKIDVTLRGRYDEMGSLHPVTRVVNRVTELFASVGFKVVEGPEIESEYYNFEALNIPADHPARAMHDTFYLTGDQYLLRTHTSPVQIREMEKHGVPVRLITLGRVFRKDFDQTHTPMFHQIEGLVIDKHCTFSDLKGLLQQFFNQFFETEVQLRFRPSYFPFTEPSAEVDMYHTSKQRWLELLGCGMVHPNVLKGVNVDPNEYSGFAFGMGLDRLAMLRYDVSDLRLFFENDLRFLEQF